MGFFSDLLKLIARTAMLFLFQSDDRTMPFERNLESSDEDCPDCPSKLELDKESMLYFCRQCEAQKTPA